MLSAAINDDVPSQHPVRRSYINLEVSRRVHPDSHTTTILRLKGGSTMVSDGWGLKVSLSAQLLCHHLSSAPNKVLTGT